MKKKDFPKHDTTIGAHLSPVKFSAGDRVKCIQGVDEGLELGREYKVIVAMPPLIFLEEFGESKVFHFHHFKPIEPMIHEIIRKGIEEDLARFNAALSLKQKKPEPIVAAQEIVIEFDGGSRSYDSTGFGSWMIDDHPIQRKVFRDGMLSGEAEVLTMLYAMRQASLICDPGVTALRIHGDCQEALFRCTKMPKKTCEKGYYAACNAIRLLVKQFHTVTTHWRSRQRSIELFGH
jgi:hypothetical protein